MRNVDCMAVAEKAMQQIKKGAFITVKSGEDLNTMTIGWATIGFVWRKPVLMVAIRDSRHTFGIIEKAADFTVSVPLTDMHDAVMFCGTKSGRDVDKRVNWVEAVFELNHDKPVLRGGIGIEIHNVLGI